MTKVVFPGTFDPVTLGHVDMIKRATQLFTEVHIAVAESPATTKTTRWSIEQRQAWMQQAVADFSGVYVHRFSGLLVDFLKQIQIPVFIRGLRSMMDWNFEAELFRVHQVLWPEVEMLCMVADPKWGSISSTYVREILSYGGDISALVPAAVLRQLKTI